MKVKRTYLVVGGAIAGMLLSGCQWFGTAPLPSEAPSSTSAVSSPPTPRPTLSSDFVNRIDGSTATIPLVTAALRLLRGTDDGMIFNQTDQAYINLIDGDADVIFVTAPSDAELQQARQEGVDLEVVPIVKDALVFLANTANPVNGLTQRQIKDIYSGKVTNWAKVGGADLPIIAYQRPENSGSQTLFEQLAMGGKQPMNAPVSTRPDEMSGLVDYISAYSNSKQALGFSVFYYTQEMYVKSNVKLLAVDGVAPSRQTIAEGTYPYGTYYYAVLRSDEPTGSTARQLVDWCLSDEGQKVFAAASYVPLDQSNIVPPDSGYGYDGSTPENTTQSEGTGGPAGKSAPLKKDICVSHGSDTDCLVDDVIRLPGYPKAEAAVTDWYSSLPPDPAPAMNSSISDPDESFETNLHMFSNRGLLVAERSTSWDGYDRVTSASAVFRLSDGHRMSLSDFFYDGVNYIDFINRNLLDEAANQLRFDCLTQDFETECIGGDLIAPFTGLPATTLDFTYTGTGLEFRLPAGNPFLTRSIYGLAADCYVEINLPSDLSPYGVIWRTKTVQVGAYQVDHIVSNYRGTNPHDATINKAIDAWARTLKYDGVASVSIYAQGARLEVRAGSMSNHMEGVEGPYSRYAWFDYLTGKRLN